jgi:DNA-binding protein YbaB
MDLDALSRSLGPLQETMRKASSERSGTVFTGSAGGGAVKLALSGDLVVAQVQIAPAAAAGLAHDPGMVEDLIRAATDDALRQYRSRFGATPEEQIQKLFAGGGMGQLLGPLMASLGKH